jgi:hypothetical protein
MDIKSVRLCKVALIPKYVVSKTGVSCVVLPLFRPYESCDCVNMSDTHKIDIESENLLLKCPKRFWT